MTTLFLVTTNKCALIFLKKNSALNISSLNNWRIASNVQVFQISTSSVIFIYFLEQEQDS